MYAKIENNTLIPAPHRIVLSGMQIFNPTPDHLTQAGYKLVTETPIPEDPAPEGNITKHSTQIPGIQSHRAGCWLTMNRWNLPKRPSKSV